jgi:hypothetical protein
MLKAFKFFFVFLVFSVATIDSIAGPKRNCLMNCLAAITNLQRDYRGDSKIAFSIQNLSKGTIFVNVAVEGESSGIWKEVLTSMTDPHAANSKMVFLQPIKKGIKLDLQYEPSAEVAANHSALLRIRLDVYKKGALVEQLRSAEFRVMR